MIEEVIEGLRKNEFNVSFAENSDVARKIVLEMIPP
mgnify:CR=1 FL=1